jgi:nucleotide-binding universal stress UspA family protein
MKNRFKKILVGFDNSPSAKSAIEKAVNISERFESQIQAVYVVKNSKDSRKEEVIQFIEELSTRRNVDIELIERHGRVYKEISTLEREVGADLIIVGTHGSDGWQPFWIGSNAFRIVSSSNCPVITIQEDTIKAGGFAEILVPIDDSPETRQKMPYVSFIANAFNSKVHLLGATHSKSNESKQHVETFVKQCEKYLAERKVDFSSSITSGVNLPQYVVEQAKELRTGLIIMMTETEKMGMVMSSYAQDVINNSSVAVMSIHSRDLMLHGSAGY